MRNNKFVLLAAILLSPIVSVTLCVPASGQAAAPNPNSVAILRWYPANLATQFSTGLKQPNVTKLRASDGKNLGTFNLPGQPGLAAFDGANVWITINSSTTVSKM
jgi:hypothetical protein